MPEENTSLISDLTGLSKPLTKLIETVGTGINVVTTPWQTKRNAKAEAEAIDIIKASLNDVNGDITYTGTNFSITVKQGSIEGTALSRMVNEAVERQLNLNDIYKKTASILEATKNVSDTPVNHDWFVRYRNIVQDISNDELQGLWAKILANEIETPNSCSLRTLDFLKNIQTHEAEIIQKLMQYCVKSIGNEVFIFGGKEYLKSIGIPFTESLLLEELNLATDDLSLTLMPSESFIYYRLSHTQNYLRVRNNSDKKEYIPLLKLTSLGREIYNLTPPFFDYETLVAQIKYLHKPLFEFELLKDVIIDDYGTLRWASANPIKP